MPKRLTKMIDGEKHTLCVFKVISTFPNGTPRVVERVPEQGTVHVDEGMEFITAYVPSVNFETSK